MFINNRHAFYFLFSVFFFLNSHWRIYVSLLKNFTPLIYERKEKNVNIAWNLFIFASEFRIQSIWKREKKRRRFFTLKEKKKQSETFCSNSSTKTRCQNCVQSSFYLCFNSSMLFQSNLLYYRCVHSVHCVQCICYMIWGENDWNNNQIQWNFTFKCHTDNE